MRLTKRLTPYPVLSAGDDDYVDSHFDVSLEQQIEFGELKVQVDFDLENEGLENLIREGKAGFALHFECALLCYRTMVLSAQKSVSQVIDLDEIGQTVEVSTFIVALRDISSYHNAKFNWQFGKLGADISKGNVLAIGPTYTIDIDRSRDGLKKLSDIISIQFDRGNQGAATVDLDGDIIRIGVKEEIKNQYYVHGKEYRYTAISMLLVPAMVYVLTRMKRDGDFLRDYRWFEVIERLLKQNRVEVEQLDEEGTGHNSIYEVAQRIFKSPLDKGFSELGGERIAL